MPLTRRLPVLICAKISSFSFKISCSQVRYKWTNERIVQKENIMTLVSLVCDWHAYLISGTLRSTPPPWPPVLSNIEPPALRRKAAIDKLAEKIVKHDSCQSSLISLTHHCYDWHPGSRCGYICNQLTSKVDGGITGSRLRWSILT